MVQKKKAREQTSNFGREDVFEDFPFFLGYFRKKL